MKLEELRAKLRVDENLEQAEPADSEPDDVQISLFHESRDRLFELFDREQQKRIADAMAGGWISEPKLDRDESICRTCGSIFKVRGGTPTRCDGCLLDALRGSATSKPCCMCGFPMPLTSGLMCTTCQNDRLEK